MKLVPRYTKKRKTKTKNTHTHTKTQNKTHLFRLRYTISVFVILFTVAFGRRIGQPKCKLLWLI